MKTAITRLPADSIANCQLTHVDRAAVDPATARLQHENYRALLAKCNYTVITLPPVEDYPDSVFVEDTAVILPEAAILLPLGTETRRGEAGFMLETLDNLVDVRQASADTRIEGGDVLRIGNMLFTGKSSRTDGRGVEELRRLTSDLGYEVTPVEVRGSLHLKTAVTALDDATVLLNPDWVATSDLGDFEVIEVDGREPFAANILRLGDKIVAHEGFPYTIGRLRNAGFEVLEVDISEFLKAEAGLTCLSLLL